MTIPSLKLDEKEIRQLLKDLSGEVQEDYKKECERPCSPNDSKNKIKQDPAIYPLLVNCANYCRLTYAISILPENDKSIILNLDRQVPHFGTKNSGKEISGEVQEKFEKKIGSIVDEVEDRIENFVEEVEEELAGKGQIEEILTKLKRFNTTLNYYKESLKAELSIDLELLKTFKVDNLGGTSYLGVDKAKKFLIVAFKGSKTFGEWVKTNFNIIGVDYKPLNPWGYDNKEVMQNVKIHGGFYESIKNLSNPEHNIFNIVDEHLRMEKYKDYRLLITGHSLGGSLASLFGIEAQICGWNPLVVTLASPKIGYVHGSDISFPEKITKLFELNVKKVNDTATDLKKVIDPKFGGVFINVDHIGDIVPFIPLAPYERLGGIPYILKAEPVDWEDFKPQILSLDADDDLTEIIEDNTFAKRTCKDQKYMDSKFDTKTLFGETFADKMDEKPQDFNRLQEEFVQKIGQVLRFGDIFDRLSELHQFYTLYAISLDGSVADFISIKPISNV